MEEFHCLLVYPKFAHENIWGWKEVCEVLDVKCPDVPLGLLTVAAMLPSSWKMSLVDRNARELTDDTVNSADIVFLGGMLPQCMDMLELIELFHERGKKVVIGGPGPTANPEMFDSADHLVLGEAEVTLGEFLTDFASGEANHVYDPGDRRADLTKTPVPRFDLVNLKDYLMIGIQVGRGCPFKCEFCDIIVLFGRKQRLKTTEQIFAELQALYDLGHRGSLVIEDDNFIGNKRLIKPLLEQLYQWQVDHDWPFEFGTQVSINLADDEELMALMKKVGFIAVFIGLETPDEQLLLDMKKKQNVHRSISESIKKIQTYSMRVDGSFVIGFDNEDSGVAKRIVDLVEEAHIPLAMLSLLYAVPKTALRTRLEEEGRLLPEEDYETLRSPSRVIDGLNFIPTRPREEILRDYKYILKHLYNPTNYFERVYQLCGSKNFIPKEKKTRDIPISVRQILRIFAKLLVTPSILFPFLKTFFKSLFRQPKLALVVVFAFMLALFSLSSFTRKVSEDIDNRLAR